MDRKQLIACLLLFTFSAFSLNTRVDAVCQTANGSHTIRVLEVKDAISFTLDVTSDLYNAIFATTRTPAQQDLYNQLRQQLIQQLTSQLSSLPDFNGVVDLQFQKADKPAKRQAATNAVVTTDVFLSFVENTVIDTAILGNNIIEAFGFITLTILTVPVIIVNNSPLVTVFQVSNPPFLVYFYLSTRTDTGLTPVTAANIASTSFSNSKETVFVIHGFTTHGTDAWLVDMKDGLLTVQDYNVVLVDWGIGAAGPNYFQAVGNIPEAAKQIANFITACGILRSTVYCIGHSLGSHVCGFTGKNGQINRITALDPAGPILQFNPSNQRLAITDATYVDAIHTDGFYGSVALNYGHKDFWPNGGNVQPGCGVFTTLPTDFTNFNLVDALACSHRRSIKFFRESLTSSCKFTSTQCGDYLSYTLGWCSCAANGCSPMGYYAWDSPAQGIFYCDTNAVSPYCKS